MPSKKKNIKNQKAEKPTKRSGSDSHGKDQKPSFAKQLVPYIFAVVAVFLLICMVSNLFCNPQNSLAGGKEGDHTLGVFGFWICQIIFGIFGPAAYAVPVILFCFVIFWKNYNNRDFVAINSVIAVITAVSAAAFIHTVTYAGRGKEAFAFDLAEFFENGAKLQGGGFLGGVLSTALVLCFNVAGAIIVLVALLIPLITFLAGTTPLAIASWIIEKIKVAMAEQRELAKERREEAAEEKKILAEEARAERAAIRAEEREERAREREAARAEREAARIAAKEEKARLAAEKEAARNADEQKEDDDKADAVIVPIIPRDGASDKKPEEKKCNISIDGAGDGENTVKLNVFSSDEIKRLDELKAEKSPSVQTDEEAPVFDEDEQGADGVFPADERKATPDGETFVFIDPNEVSKKTRGNGAVDDIANDIFDSEGAVVDPETGEVFVPLVQDRGFKSAREFEAANNKKEDEYFIGDKPPVDIPRPEYKFPPVDLLEEGPTHYSSDPAEVEKNAELLRSVLADFKINVTDISCSCGPTITRYEVKPEAGVRVRSIANLVDDISYGLAKSGVRIEAPIPGKAAVGIEVPNDKPAAVKLRSLIETPEFKNHKSVLAACLGADVSGKPVVFDIEKMPHLLVAGTTGSGKSVCINSILMSILYHAKPEEVKLLLIDPKKVEFKVYRDVPHLCCRIISDPKKAAGALNTAVNEMEKRFALIEEVGVRNIAGYNEATKNDPDKPYMPRMVIVIDEFADLMMTAKDEVETAVVRIAQKARAAGIHLIIGTQRPSVNVITGLIKANIPSRIAFTVMSGMDSRIILDTIGAEKLCGRGDMLFAPVGAPKPARVQGAFVSDDEVEAVVEFAKSNNAPVIYDQEFEASIDNATSSIGNNGDGIAISQGSGSSGGSGDEDSKFWDAVELAIDAGKISTSLLQRRIEVGYGRAAKIIDRMEEMGFVSAPDGNKPRKILITREEYEEKRNSLGDGE